MASTQRNQSTTLPRRVFFGEGCFIWVFVRLYWEQNSRLCVMDWTVGTPGDRKVAGPQACYCVSVQSQLPHLAPDWARQFESAIGSAVVGTSSLTASVVWVAMMHATRRRSLFSILWLWKFYFIYDKNWFKTCLYSAESPANFRKIQKIPRNTH